MVPTMLDSCTINIVPSLLCHQHSFKKVEIKCASAECMSVVSLEAPDDSSIKWLDKGCQIRLKVFKLNISRFIIDEMVQKVVDYEADVMIFPPHLYIKLLDIPVLICQSHWSHGHLVELCHPLFKQL
jgi:hypothetical protein